MQFKFQPKSSIHAEVINVLVNPRWRPPPSWIFQNLAFLMKFSNFLMPKYIQFKFQPNSSIQAEAINILVNPRWRPPPPWIFKITHFLTFAICAWLFLMFLFNLAVIGQRMQKWHRNMQCFYLH